MTPMKPWQLLALLALVILAILFLARYSRSLEEHRSSSHHPIAAARLEQSVSWVQE
ncbi:MAG TPA: hypothetical protein VNJ51_13605 [Candidatus Dormibacteraeota bacterium]|nr:hypothetical protein [Candidatus Dormibacteraeota bacterium]